MWRKSILVAFAAASIGLTGQAANAKDKDIGHKTKDYVEGICNEKGGTYWANPEGTNYGCGYKGDGGIICDKDTGCLEITREVPDTPWGLVGLLGLAGLAGLLGLRGRGRDANIDRRGNPVS